MTTCAPGVGQQKLVQGGRTGPVPQEGANVNQIRHAGHPQGIAGKIGEVVLRQVLELRPCLLRASEFAVDQRQAGTPGASHRVLLNKVAHDGFEFLEAALLAAQGKHLQAKDAGSVFRLQALANGEGFLGQALAVGEAALHQGPHGPKPCGEAKFEGLLRLFRQAGVRVDLCIGGQHISQFEQAIAYASSVRRSEVVYRSPPWRGAAFR